MDDRQCCVWCDELAERQAQAVADSKTDVQAVHPVLPPAKPAVSSGGNCHQAGPITRNPFFNYMRSKRQNSCSFSITAMAKEAAREWLNMSVADRQPFVADASHVQPSVRRLRRRSILLANPSRGVVGGGRSVVGTKNGRNKAMH